MGFIKEDYMAARKRRNMIISFGALIGIIGIIIFSVVFSKKSPQESHLINSQNSVKEKENVVKAQPSQLKTGEKDLPAIIKETRNSVVLINTFDRKGNPLGIGSGFFITETGDIISNRHVFKDAHSAKIETTNGTFQIAAVMAQNQEKDIARFSIGKLGRKFHPLKMSDTKPQVGESIMVIGNPFGLEATVSNGIVSATRNFPPFGEVIQITCPISPGSSGSPVLNMKGEVIGVATFQLVQGQNLNFAIPIAHAKALKLEGDQELASTSFESSQLIDSLDSPFDQGMMYYSRQEYESALSCFEKAIEKNPHNAEAYYQLGMCYKEVQATNAVDAFKKAIEIKPEYAEAYLNLGLTYLMLNMREEAIKALRTAKEIKPDYDEALFNLGIAYGMNKQYESAISVLKKAVEIFPDTKAYYYLAVSYAALKQNDKAIFAFKQSLAIDPENMDSYVGLGFLFILVENWRQGIKTMNKAVLIDPSNAEVHFILGMLHLGNLDVDSSEIELTHLKNCKDSSKLRSKLESAISTYKQMQRYRRR